ncbi:MAG: hypothetical protein WDO70_05185 [Alphaproteobacteria bacterium]
MKRNRQHDALTVRGSDVKQNLSQEQLAAIGAVTIAWNEMELFINYLVCVCAWIPWPLVLEVTTRINGLEGQVQIIRKSIELHARMKLIDDETVRNVGRSLDAILEFKKYRDAVVHARVLDSAHGIGELIRKQGKQEEVLLTVEALTGLYDRLALLREELVLAFLIFRTIYRSAPLDSSRDDRPNKQSLAQAIQAYTAQFLPHQQARLSLPPLPSFPDLPPMPDWTATPPASVQN